MENRDEGMGRNTINWGLWGPLVALVSVLLVILLLAWIGSSMARPIKPGAEKVTAERSGAGHASETGRPIDSGGQASLTPGNIVGGGVATAGALVVGGLGVFILGAGIVLVVLWIVMPYLIYQQLVALGEIKRRVISLEERFRGGGEAPPSSM